MDQQVTVPVRTSSNRSPLCLNIQRAQQLKQQVHAVAVPESSVNSVNNNNNVNSNTSNSDPCVKSQVASAGCLSPNLQPSSPTCYLTPQQFQLSLLGGKYMLYNQVEASTFYHCINVVTQEEYFCKIVKNDESGKQLLSAHYRTDCLPHVNSLHEALVGDRHIYLIFPRCYGDLHSHVRNKRRLREAEARAIFRQIAEAVHSCHERGLVLRDLKLRKFVFEDANRSVVKLECLEDAVLLGEEEEDLLHDKHGCPAYVSPEILTASQYSGKAADLWSLGVMLYTMLVGRYPFHDNEHVVLFAKIRGGRYVLPDHLSSRAKCLIRSLLRRDPAERLTSGDVLLHPWFTARLRSERDTPKTCTDQLVPTDFIAPPTTTSSAATNGTPSVAQIPTTAATLPPTSPSSVTTTPAVSAHQTLNQPPYSEDFNC